MSPEAESAPKARVALETSARRWPRGLGWLRHRHALGLIVLMAVLLHLPAVRVGLLADDYVQVAALEGQIEGSDLGPWNLFDFGTLDRDGDPWQLGGLPWWTSEEFRVRFLRPVPSLLRAWEHGIVGRAAWPGHLANALCMGLLVLLVARLHRALGMEAEIALLAALLFAADESSALPVGWLANRNSLGEALLGVMALLIALGGAGAASFRRHLLALLFALLATLCKESGIVFLVLVPLAILWRARPLYASAKSDTTRPPLWTMALGPACAFLYLVVYVHGGYGANSGFYPEPWTHPLATLSQFAVRLPAAALSLSSPVPADLVFVEPWLLWVFASLGAVVLGWVVRRLRRVANPAMRRSVLPLVVLFLVTLAPQAAAPLADRLLLVPAIAFGGLLAMAFASVPWISTRGVHTAALLLVSALPLSAFGVLSRLDVLDQMADEARRVAETLAPDEGTRHVWMLQGPSGLALLSLSATWPMVGGDGALGVHNLQLGPRALVLHRLSETDFEVRSADEPFLARPMESVFLSADAPVGAVRRWRGALFEVTALEGTGGFPAALRVRFDASPESLGVALFRADEFGSHGLDWPRSGHSIQLPRASSAIPLAP
ncbi:MAG: hypothetical protein GC161_11550 [Planctomycetaceae bacterium]|nr:hypothetical protein [Planctomycetaceae bacterium]